MSPDLSEKSIRDLSSLVQNTNCANLKPIILQLRSHDNYNDSEDRIDLENLLMKLVHRIQEDISLISEFSKLLYFLLHKKKVVLQNNCLLVLIEFIISGINSASPEAQVDSLFALSALLSRNPDGIEKYKSSIIKEEDSCSKFFNSTPDTSAQYGAFQCLLSLLKNLKDASLSSGELDLCCRKCILVLTNKTAHNYTELTRLKITISALKCLQLIFVYKNVPVQNFGELLGILKTLLFYGLPGQIISTDISLFPTLRCPDIPHTLESMSESDSPYPKIRKQKKNKRKSKRTPQKKQQEDIDERSNCEPQKPSSDFTNLSFSSPKRSLADGSIKSSSSDSEFSDAENLPSKIKSLSITIRQNAYLALQAIVKVTEKKVMFGYWSAFLPEHQNMPGLSNSANIFTTILKDPVQQVRLCSLNLLGEMLRGSKQFLMHADGRNAKSMSFTSLSSILASMIGEIHRCLFLALLSENNNILLTQILKCYAVLSENVPYAKLNKDILFKLLKQMKNCLFHSDIQVQVASLAVFCSVISSDQTPVEFEALILSSDFDSAIDALSNSPCPVNVDHYLDGEEPWIISICRKNIYCDEPLPLKLQSVQLLIAVLGKCFSRLKLFFNTISEVILFCLMNSDSTMQLHGAKLLDSFGRFSSSSVHSEVIKSIQPEVSSLWQKSLAGSIIQCISKEENKSLQGICCDCLSSLPAFEFESLPPKLQITYITTLLGLADDSNINVRGAAIRCLGLFCLFPCLNQDASFLDDFALILAKSVNDSNATVRFKASWALGNLSDTLFLNRDKYIENKQIPALFFYSVGMTCIDFFKDSDRIKANAVRALGNFLYFVPENFLRLPTIQEFVKKSCIVLQTSLTVNFMKVCWNACYALGNVFKNEHLIACEFVDLEKLLISLLNVLSSPNFKVRISAVQSLSSLTCRRHFGSLYTHVWEQLIAALLSATRDANFKEIKHQENLCDQICLSLCKLSSIFTDEDLPKIVEVTFEDREILLTSMWKLGSRISKEKGQTICLSVEKLNLFPEKDRTDIKYSTFVDVFNQAVVSFYQQDNS